jgi:hypothetical protein
MKKIYYSVYFGFTSFAQEIAQVKYGGGGDWYNPTSLPNLDFAIAI